MTISIWRILIGCKKEAILPLGLSEILENMLKSCDNYNSRLMSSISLLSVLMFCGVVTAEGQESTLLNGTSESQRKEIAPKWYIDSSTTLQGTANPGYCRVPEKNMQMVIGIVQ